MKRKFLSTQALTEIALLLGIAIVLQIVTFLFVIFNIGIGGSISISMLPLFIIVYRHGFRNGMVAGIIYGIFEMTLYSVMVASLAATLWVFLAIVFLDYVVAFGILAVSAFVFNLKKGHVAYFVIGIVVGGLLRYSIHVFSGVLLFRDWLIEAYPNVPIVFGSIALNAFYMVPSIFATALLGALVFARIKGVLDNKTNQ